MMRLTPALLFIALALGCGEADPLRTLERADVTGLPAGTAVGTMFSGSYLVTSGAVTGCRCRVGNCAGFSIQIGGSWMATEQDGSLTMTTPDGWICMGGIDADGSLQCGGATEQTDAAVYFLNDGKIRTENGLPTTASMTTEGTIRASTNGVVGDCDLRTQTMLRYAGP
jgi:hypothetical protein